MKDSRNDMPINLENEMKGIYTEWCKEAKKNLDADSDFDEYYEKHASKDLKEWYEKKNEIKKNAFRVDIIID